MTPMNLKPVIRALPFLKILGQLSPQVTQGDSQFISDARPGMIFNTVTNQLYDGQKGIVILSIESVYH